MSEEMNPESTESTGNEAVSAPKAPSQPIVAGPSKSFRLIRIGMFVMMFGMALYFIYDGYIGYPGHNQKYDDIAAERDTLEEQATAEQDEEKKKELKKQVDAKSAELKEHGDKHTEFDISLQKIIGYCLVPISILLLGFWLYRSRGKFVVDQDTIQAPGHPPVPLADLVELDEKLWKRKGIMFVRYELAGGEAGEIKLDDFIYDAKPIGEIVKLVRWTIDPEGAAKLEAEKAAEEAKKAEDTEKPDEA